MTRAGGGNDRLRVFPSDPHARRRRKRRTLAVAAGLREFPPLIYTLQTILR